MDNCSNTEKTEYSIDSDTEEPDEDVDLNGINEETAVSSDEATDDESDSEDEETDHPFPFFFIAIFLINTLMILFE